MKRIKIRERIIDVKIKKPKIKKDKTERVKMMST